MMRAIEATIGERLQGEKDRKPPILILGVGNFLMGDEGIGVHFIHEIINQKIYFENADVIDGGVGGFALMSYFDEYDHIVFVDATMDGKPSGTVSEIKPRFASDFPKALSAHDFGLKDMIESQFILGKMPELYLFTISIPEIRPMTIELSSEVRAAIPELIEKVGGLVEEIGHELE